MKETMKIFLLCIAGLWNGILCAFPQDFLLATDWRRHDIYVVGLNGQQNIPMNLSTKYPAGVTFNPVTREVFWSEHMLHGDPDPSAIKKVTLDAEGSISGHASMTLMRDTETTSTAKYMAVDYRTGNVWLAHRYPAAIKVVDRNLMKSATIISENLMKPTGIVVHPKMRMIYFCDEERLTIESAYMDGKNRRVLIKTETPPLGLTTDVDGGRLYWMDDTMNALVTVDLNGNGLRMMIRGHYNFQSIVLDDYYVYYTDTLLTTVQKISKHGQPSPMSMGNFGIGHMYALALHKRSTNLEVDTQCTTKNGGCPSDSICLPTPSGYSCGRNNLIVEVPSPPMFIETVYRSSTRVTLSWSPPMKAVSSYLVRYLKVGSTDTQEVNINGDLNVVELIYLDPDSQYDVSIFSVNMDYVMSSTSAKIGFTTESQRPLVRIISGPEDVTTKANMDVLMHCEVDDITNDLHLVWVMEEPYKEIYSYKNGQGSLTDMTAKKYEVTINRFKFYLRIRNVQWSDGVTYKCEIKGSSGSMVSANLVVIHDMEFMTPTLAEGKSGRFMAAGYYGSPKRDKLLARQIPFMKCFIDESDYLMGITTTEPGITGEANYVIRWEITMKVLAEHDRQNFTCRIGTYHPDFYVDFTTSLEVLYGVRNIRLEPMKDLYVYGDSATCMADGNPVAEYSWTNNRMGMTFRSQTLQLTGNMAKDSWRCRAYNVIDGEMKSMELQHTVRMKDQYCLYGDACRALCRNNPTSTMSDTMDYCCITFAPCDQCSGYGPNNCHKTMCAVPSNIFSNGRCEC